MHIYLRGTQTESMVQRVMVFYTGTKCDPFAFALPRILGESKIQSNKECSCI